MSRLAAVALMVLGCLCIVAAAIWQNWRWWRHAFEVAKPWDYLGLFGAGLAVVGTIIAFVLRDDV